MTAQVLSTPDAVRADARLHARQLVAVDLTGCTDKTALMQRFAETLSLPDAFGRNWDALTDVLRDLPEDAHGIVVLVHGAAALRDAAPTDHAVLQDILAEWQSEHGEQAATAYLFDEPIS